MAGNFNFWIKHQTLEGAWLPGGRPQKVRYKLVFLIFSSHFLNLTTVWSYWLKCVVKAKWLMKWYSYVRYMLEENYCWDTVINAGKRLLIMTCTALSKIKANATDPRMFIVTNLRFPFWTYSALYRILKGRNIWNLRRSLINITHIPVVRISTCIKRCDKS